jgi:Tfp pilus assembly protein PilE
MTTRGFTLIEAVIYLALFSILIGGAVVAAWSLFDAATRSATRTMLSEELDFMLSKTDYVLSSTKEVTEPQKNNPTPETTLRVVRWNETGFVTLSWSPGDKDFRLDGEPLNNTNVSVESVGFRHVADPGVGTSPEYIEAVITAAARTPGGDLVYRTGTTTVYLRR